MALWINLKIQLVEANLVWTIPKIKVYYILFAKYTYGNKRVEIYWQPHSPPPIHSFGCVNLVSSGVFLPFCDCVHEVNMTHACMQVPHTPVLIQCITPLLRVKIPDRINRVPLCTYISHVGCNIGEMDVMTDYICTNIHISILFSYLHYVGWNSAGMTNT